MGLLFFLGNGLTGYAGVYSVPAYSLLTFQILARNRFPAAQTGRAPLE